MRLKFKQIYVQKNISFTSLAKTLNTFNIILKSLNLLITGIIQPSDFYQMYFVIHNFFWYCKQWDSLFYMLICTIKIISIDDLHLFLIFFSIHQVIKLSYIICLEILLINKVHKQSIIKDVKYECNFCIKLYVTS